MEKSNIVPKVETWDKVAEDYNIEISESEKELAYEIIENLNEVGMIKGSKLLELGSGSGHLSAVFAMEGYAVTLLDFSEKALEKSRETFERYGLNGEFIKGDLMNLPDFDKEYDLVWNSGVMEHFEEEELISVFHSIKRVVKNRFMIIVPNPNSLPYLMMRYKAMEKGNWPYGTEYLRDNYIDILKEVGLYVTEERYLAGYMSKEHLDYVFGNSENTEYFKKLVDSKIINDVEKYLVMYLGGSKAVNKVFNETQNYREEITEYRTAVFDLTANMNGIRNEYVQEINTLKTKIQDYHNLILNNNIEKDNIINEQNKMISFINGEKVNLLNESNMLKTDIQAKVKGIETLNLMVKNLEHEVERKEKLNEEVSSLNDKIRENLNEIYNKNQQIDSLEKAKILAIDKLKEISTLKPYRLAHSFRRIKHQYKNGSQEEKKQFRAWLKNKVLRKPTQECHKYDPLFEVINLLNNTYSYMDSLSAKNVNYNDIDEKSTFLNEYNFRYNYYNNFINEKFHEETKQIIQLIESKKYKGIVVYPEAVYWEPVQRPQHILREFAKEGFLCFFCEFSQDSFKIDEKEENLYVINNSAYLLAALKTKSIIVLCTWLLQMAWADQISNKYIWYDVLDQLEYLSLYDNNYLIKHNEMLKKADFVSYSANLLKKYVDNRKNAYYLPNAANINDFLTMNDKEAGLISEIKSKGHKIIGYYGAIENWFNKDIINNLAQKHEDWEFVIIGAVGLDTNDITSNNVHFTGKIPYKELRKFADYFDVAIIPFIVNDLTDCVSPVKFFEYAALGKPVVTTPIKEMKQYECEWVLVASNEEEFENAIIEAMQDNVKGMAEHDGINLARKNQWKNRVDIFLDYLNNRVNGWKVYSNLNFANSVCAYAETFLDFRGDNFYAGGAERYLIDLAEICKQKGFNFYICQYGNYQWVRRFKDISIISLGSNYLKANSLIIETINNFNREFYHMVNNRTRLSIYSPFFISIPYVVTPNIGISHGICWDSKFNNFKSGSDFWNDKKRFIDGANNLKKIVSVDTNTANWFQTINFELSKNIKVIPNYVDLNEFKPIEKDIKDDKIVITYPRRLYEARGLYLVLNILDDLLTKYPQVEFHFIGRGFQEDTRYVKEKVDKWNGRVKWYSLLPEEMPRAYETSDITLIPTLYSEGTSLSCLEAMASGNVVVATRVGGLTDLIIDGFNGCLIGLQENELLEALELLINNRNLREELSKNGRNMAKTFSKEKWKQKWEKVLDEYLDEDRVSETKDREKHVKIYLSNGKSINNEKIKSKIIESLIQGDFVEVRINDKTLREDMSFGRIQFVSWETESLYSKPDLTIADKEASKGLECKIDIVLE